MLVAQDFELVQHGGIIHLVARRLRVVCAEDKTMAAIQVADIGHIDQGVGILFLAKICRFG